MTPFKPYQLYLNGELFMRFKTARQAARYMRMYPAEGYELYLRSRISRFDRSKGRRIM